MKKILVTAKNVQKAIEQGLKELGATQEEVDIKIVDEGGLFRKAKVELVFEKGIEEDVKVEETKKESKEDLKKAKKEKKVKVKEDKKQKEIKSEETPKQTKKSENKTQQVGDICEVAKNFLKNLFEKMLVEAEVACEKTADGISFNATGEKVSTLIGKRGETLNAIQEVLTNVVKNAGFREEKVFFDVENYKNRREMSLANLAERMAKKALKIEKPIKLERMNAYERKIIHTALQNFDGVTTRSEGEEPNRFLIIIPTKKNNIEEQQTSEIIDNAQSELITDKQTSENIDN